MQKMKAFTNVIQCIKTKDALVPIGYCVEEMPLLKGGHIIIKEAFYVLCVIFVY